MQSVSQSINQLINQSVIMNNDENIYIAPNSDCRWRKINNKAKGKGESDKKL